MTSLWESQNALRKNNVGKELSQAEIQEIVNHPLRHKKEYYLRVFKLALERGITKREQNETY